MSETKKYVRPTWDQTCLEVVDVMGKRGTCDRGRSGCVISSKDQLVVATGYVGSVAGMPHCDDVGHQFAEVLNEDGTKSTHCVRTVHAEANAIVNAAKTGMPTAGATLYCTMEPCAVCAGLIVNAGIVRVVAQKKYHRAQKTREIFQKCGVNLVVVKDVIAQYGNQ